METRKEIEEYREAIARDDLRDQRKGQIVKPNSEIPNMPLTPLTQNKRLIDRQQEIAINSKTGLPPPRP